MIIHLSSWADIITRWRRWDARVLRRSDSRSHGKEKTKKRARKWGIIAWTIHNKKQLAVWAVAKSELEKYEEERKNLNYRIARRLRTLSRHLYWLCVTFSSSLVNTFYFIRIGQLITVLFFALVLNCIRLFSMEIFPSAFETSMESHGKCITQARWAEKLLIDVQFAFLLSSPPQQQWMPLGASWMFI